MLSSNAMHMNKLNLYILFLLPTITFGQIINKGAEIYSQTGAYIRVKGAFVNNGGSVKNDGVIEVDGDFENGAGASFGVYNDNTSTERAVKFVGAGPQAIKGDMSSANASFYNMVIDKANTGDVVEMQTPVNVNGSVVFGSATTTASYKPSALYTNNNQKGLIKTYSGADEHVLALTNGSKDAIAGYADLVMNGAPSTAYVITKGARGSANGGLQRKVSSNAAYVFPIGTEEHGFNGVRMNFSHIPAGGGNVIGKFNDGSDAATGAAGVISQQYDAYNGNGYVNPGYNRYFATNPCNNGAPQWVVLEDAMVNHGYWSFAADANNNDFSYVVETFPNSFVNLGTDLDMMRTVKYDAAYGFNPSAEVWNSFIDSVSSANDLLEYSRNTGTCYTGAGIPGGVYTGMAHFALKGARTNNALPVQMVYLKATPKQKAIEVAWATAIEINNRGFEVKRSLDGVSFTTIGWVNGHNNSTTEHVYAYMDNNVAANTVYYYQLNQIDNDGANEKSNIVSAIITGDAAVAVSEPMPNPAVNASHIVVSVAGSQEVTMKLFNMLGQQMDENVFALQAGDNTLNLNLSSLASGTYNAVLSLGGKTVSKKLVVSNN
jgi:hypothetical protein